MSVLNTAFSVLLDTVYQGALPSYAPLNASFAVTWDYDRNMGNATVTHINSVETGMGMFPMGIRDKLNFMGREGFWVEIPDGEKFFTYRVILSMKPHDDEFRSAAMMLGEQGDDIITTANWEKSRLF